MKSETKITDIIALNVWVYFHSKIGWIVVILASSYISISILTYLKDKDLLIQIIIFIAAFSTTCACIILAVTPIIALIIISSYFQKGCIGQKEFKVTKDSFTENDGFKETEVSWKNVKGIYKTKKHIFIKIPKLKYIIIPGRSFENEYKFNLYYTELLKFRSDYT